MIYAIGFGCALLEAIIIWLLSSHVHKRHEAFLQSRLEAAEKTILALTDRIQAPTTPDFVKRQEAQASIEDRKLLAPEKREEIRQAKLVEEIIASGDWRDRPEFANVEDVALDDNGNPVLQYPPDDTSFGMPSFQPITRAEFIRPFLS